MEKEFFLDEHTEEILQLEKELHDIIDYDEWAAREYGYEKVDYYWTAVNLLKAGYRKQTVKRQVLEVIQDEIEGIKHNFPFTHDDEVKLDKLVDVYDLIDSMVKE